jgi:hypothetical protein
MALTGSRLDLVIVPRDPDQVFPLVDHVPAWLARGWLGPDGAFGPQGDAWGTGGYAAWRWESAEAPRLWANEQGGFHVGCPRGGQPLAGPFGKAWEAARQGRGPRALGCPACGEVHKLEALAFRPPAVFAREALVLLDVGAADVDARVAEALGPARWVFRRVSQRGGFS